MVGGRNPHKVRKIMTLIVFFLVLFVICRLSFVVGRLSFVVVVCCLFLMLLYCESRVGGGRFRGARGFVGLRRT